MDGKLQVDIHMGGVVSFIRGLKCRSMDTDGLRRGGPGQILGMFHGKIPGIKTND